MSKNKLKQHGNMLVGVVIGLILGLAIATVVAMFVTKKTANMESRHKSVGSAIQRDASAPMPDPNKSIYTQVAKEPSKSQTSKISKKADKVTPKKSLVYSAKQVKRPDTARVWRYYLQAGAYLRKSDAESVRAQLAFMGIEAYLKEKWSSSGTLHRVQAGPFADQTEMNQVRRQLLQGGFNPSVIRVEKK